MITIELSEQLDEIAVVAAAIGRINNRNYVDLLEKLVDRMTESEKAYMRQLYTDLKFSDSGKVCGI